MWNACDIFQLAILPSNIVLKMVNFEGIIHIKQVDNGNDTEINDGKSNDVGKSIVPIDILVGDLDHQ
jgi:hypothetical protein